jgi:hypothetical protein
MLSRVWLAGAAAILSAATLAGCATPAVPVNIPPGLSLSERGGTPGVAFSEVVEAAGSSVVAAGPVGRGDALVTVPYRYRHTAVLTEDVVGFSITVRGIQAPAGAPGYYAGTFLSSGPYVQAGASDLWCFLPSVAGGARESLCLLRNQPAIAAIAPTRMNPWLWTQFAPATGSFDYVKTPIFERRTVVIPGDLTLEYRFAGWTRSGARIEIRAVGREVSTSEVLADVNGGVHLRTIAGEYSLTRDPTDSERALVVGI